MPTLLIDMPSGVAGDMLLGALLGCGGDLARLRADLARLGLGPIPIEARRVQAGPLAAWRVEVQVPQEPAWTQDHGHSHEHGHGHGHAHAQTHGHGHRPWRAIDDLLAGCPLPPRVVERSRAAFRLLAEAEGVVHGCPAEAVEFHEVGALDAIADVVGCMLLLEQLGVDRVVAGPLLPGHGTVGCAHGLMPVPVPAVAAMLAREAPRAGVRPPWTGLGRETGELTTPTGCALVCSLADAFRDGSIPDAALRLLASGCGAGGRQVPGLMNAVRCLLTEEPAGAAGAAEEEVVELRCQMDDATGEELGHLTALLLEAGALDAWLEPVLMKKGRPGHLLAALARPADRERLCRLVLERSPSIGVRWSPWRRLALPRTRREVRVEGHLIPLKVVALPGGGERAKPEADAVAEASRALGLPFAEVARRALGG